MNRLYIPDESKQAAPLGDMTTPHPFVAHNEFLLCLWRWKGNLVMAEHTAETIPTTTDALGYLPDDCVRISIWRPFAEHPGERVEDVTEDIAWAYLCKHGPSGDLPPYVRSSRVLCDWPREYGEGAA